MADIDTQPGRCCGFVVVIGQGYTSYACVGALGSLRTAIISFFVGYFVVALVVSYRVGHTGDCRLSPRSHLRPNASINGLLRVGYIHDSNEMAMVSLRLIASVTGTE